MNDKEFDALMDKIQSEVFEEARETLGEKGFDRWRNPKFCGRLDDADGYAKLTGDCGDTMEMYIKVQNQLVNQVSYFTDGCSSSSIAGSFAAELATGKGFTEVLDLRGDDVLQEVGRFPESEEHCAHLAIRTLQEALNSYLMAQAKVD
ncbi:iron-sulfur cluster assembly scaffold protein [Desulforhopalus sp. 52FAK]